jgi:Sec-independent protein translocase protein TatA
LLIFGPKRLPEMGSAIGKTYKEFKKSMREAAEFEATDIPRDAQMSAGPRMVTAADTGRESTRA